MPELGQPPDNTHNMSFLCNATRFNVRCHICDVGTHPLSPAMWRPPGRLQGKKAAISGEIGLFGPLLGPFSSDSATLCQRPGTSVTWRTLADFGGIRTARAHIFASTPPPCRSVRGPPRGATWRQAVRSSRRSARLLPFGARNWEQINAVSGCRSPAAQRQASRKVKVSAA
jgi:hypothetical protein